MASVAIQRIDPFTKKPFTPKRSNQFFASARNRVAYHNMLAKNTRSLREKIFNQILKNHKILCELVQPDETRSLNLEVLYSKGYVRQACTHIEEFEGSHRLGICDFIIVSVDKPNNSMLVYRKKQEDGQS